MRQATRPTGSSENDCHYWALRNVVQRLQDTLRSIAFVLVPSPSKLEVQPSRRMGRRMYTFTTPLHEDVRIPVEATLSPRRGRNNLTGW